MSKKSFLLFIIGVVVLLISCNEVTDYEISDSLEAEPLTIEEIALQCYEKDFLLDSIITSRSSNFSDTDNAYFDELVIQKDGEKLLFSDLSEAQKKKFVKKYKENYVSQLVEKLKDDEQFCNMVKTENAAFYDARNSTTTRSGKIDAEKFWKSYQQNLEKMTEDNGSTSILNRSKSGPEDIIQNDLNNPKSVALLSNGVYGIGKIFVCTDSISSNSSSYIGHASLMRYNSWRETWNTNGYARATITSSPKRKSAQWNDFEFKISDENGNILDTLKGDAKIDGVQYEPIGYWAGTSKAAANNVTVIDVQHVRYDWLIVSDDDEDYEECIVTVTPTSATEHVQAFNNANKYYGRPYPDFITIPFINKNKTGKIYCSQLCYLAWKEVSKECDLSPNGWFVTPGNLISSTKSKVITKYKNK